MRKLIAILLLGIFVLVACSEQPPMKAPCNASGSNCYPRTKINQWYTGDDN
jgi:hypothetical protein